MAISWIKMRTNLWDDPRVMAVCDLTGESEAAVIGGLYWLWSAADNHTETGLLPGLSAGAVDRKTGIKGFSNALVEIGWIAETEDGITIERFEEHNGESAKKRAQGAKRTAKHRTKKGSNAGGVTQSGRKSKSGNAENVTGASPKEDKTRLDKNTSPQSAAHSSPPAGGERPNQPSAEEIYQAYPRKVGKGKALKSIEAARKKIAPLDLLQAVQEFAACCRGKDPQFIPHPTTWFNQERWLDDRSEWRRQRDGPGSDSGQKYNPDEPIDPEF